MLRFTIASLLLAPLLWRQRRLLPRSGGDRWRLLAMCAIGFVANKALEYLGLSLTTASDTALLIAAEALATVGLSVLLLRERLGRLEGLGLVLGGLGVYLVVEGGLRQPSLTGPHALGNLLVVASLVLEAGFTVIGKTIVERYPPLLITAAVVAGSLIAWWPAGLAALAVRGWPGLPFDGWLGAIYLGAIGTVLSYWGWLYGLRRVMPAAVAPLLFIQPLLGTALAVLIRDERPGLATLIGGALILGGVSTVLGQRRPAPSSPVASSGSA